MFFNRKAQITISLLLIFFILFSVFSLGIYASRETMSTAVFRSAVDAAALSAGADLAKGIDLYITLVGIRLVIFGTSLVCVLVGIIYPPSAGAVKEVEETLRKVSRSIEYISRYLPLIYLSIAEVDAYRAFNKNLEENNEHTENAHLVVIPKVLIDDIIEGNANSLKDLIPDVKHNEQPKLSNIKESLKILTSGFVIFAYKKRGYLAKSYQVIEENFGRKNNYQSSFQKFLNDNEFSLINVYPIKRTNTGVDLSDAININKFLLNYENPKGTMNKEIEDQADKTREEIKTIECNIAKTVNTFVKNNNDDISGLENSVTSTKNKVNGYMKSETDKIKQCCSNFEKCNCNGNCIDPDAVRKRFINKNNNEFSSVYNDVISIQNSFKKIEQTVKFIEAQICLGENKKSNTSYSKNLRDLLNSISSNSQFAIDSLKNIKRTIPNPNEGYACKKYVTYTDSKGNVITYCVNECHYNFSPAGNDIDSLIGKFSRIKGAANSCRNYIDNASTDIKDTTETGVRNIFSIIKGDAKDMATSFKGFPGGNVLSFFMNPEKYKCDCEGENNLSIDGINLCDFSNSWREIGRFFCAFIKDISIVQGIIEGNKFDLASYYSPVLDEPDWLKNYTSINVELNNNITDSDLLGNIKGTLEDLQTQIKNTINGEQTNGEQTNGEQTKFTSIKDKLLNEGASVMLGFFTGGPVGVLVSILTMILGQFVDKILTVIMEQSMNFVSDIINDKLGEANLDIWNDINATYSTFINNINGILNLPLRLLGENEKSYADLQNIIHSLCIMTDRIVFDENKKFIWIEE